MKTKKGDIGLLYLDAHRRLSEKAGFGRVIPRKMVFRVFGELYHVPKALRPLVLKEMEDKGLLEGIGNRKNNIKVMPV